ncbi:MAG: four helix bundle protein [Candidatus Liptonbacteria bacterium]|nr:four helix bundle protein [Candidatus Liptonbacteria bacterium]
MATYKVWHEFLPHIPKDARYTLGTKIDGLFVETVELIFTATYLGKSQKFPYVQNAATKLDLVKFFLQILWEINALDNKKYIRISEKLNEIGRMLGGWNRQLNRENPARSGE